MLTISSKPAPVWAALLSAIGATASLTFAGPCAAQPSDSLLLSSPKDFQGVVTAISSDRPDVFWLATLTRLYRANAASIHLIDNVQEGRLYLAPHGGTYGLLQQKPDGSSEIEIKKVSDQSTVTRIARSDHAFSNLLLGEAGGLILTMTPLGDPWGLHGPFEYAFWSAEGKLLERVTLPRPAKTITDPSGTGILLLEESEVRAFDSRGNLLWEAKNAYRSAALSNGLQVALLNPRELDAINQVHLIKGQKRAVFEFPSPIHKLALTQHGDRGAIAGDEGTLYLLDVPSSTLTEVTLPVDGRHFLTSLQFVDCHHLAVGIVHAQDAKPGSQRIIASSAEVLILRLDGQVLHREGVPFSAQAPWGPVVRTMTRERVVVSAPRWVKVIDAAAILPIAKPPQRSATLRPFHPIQPEQLWRRLERRFELWSSLQPVSHGWPLEPQDQSHPLMSTFGEYNRYGDIFQHAGYDIKARPVSDDEPDPTWVAITVPGRLTCSMYGETSTTNYCAVLAENGIEYTYMHLFDSCSENRVLVPACLYVGNALSIEAGDRLGFVVEYGRNFDHLHYELVQDDRVLNGLSQVVPPIEDTTNPIVSEIVLAQESSIAAPRWTLFEDQSTWGDGETQCVVVSGGVDIVARVSDHDNHGVAPLGIYRIRYDVCPSSDLACVDPRSGGSSEFSSMPYSWWIAGNSATKAQFSSDPEMVSTTDLFDKRVYYIPSNWSAGTPSAVSAWDTNLINNGDYQLTVRVVDFRGNEAEKSIDICIDNP